MPPGDTLRKHVLSGRKETYSLENLFLADLAQSNVQVLDTAGKVLEPGLVGALDLV